MNIHKFEFIICVTDETYFKECMFYIQRLRIPEGYEVSVSTIYEAESMAKAYNEAMEKSDAGYKIYMHQDVFIRNQDFLSDVLKNFQKDESIGMIGVLGAVSVPSDGYVYMAWNVGNVYACDGESAFLNDLQKGDRQVEAIDGMLMVTNRDIPWREDVLDRFDFYDVSQSFEFRKRGYKILVPNQEIPWCMHDCGHTKLKYYQEQRKKMLGAYPEFFREEGQIPLYDSKKEEITTTVKENLLPLIERNEFAAAKMIYQKYESFMQKDTELERLKNIVEIMEAEAALAEDTEKRFYQEGIRMAEMQQKYIKYKFLLRRLEYGCDKQEVGELLEDIHKQQISHIALFLILKHSIVEKASVLRMLLNVYKEEERNRCVERYEELLCHLEQKFEN